MVEKKLGKEIICQEGKMARHQIGESSVGRGWPSLLSRCNEHGENCHCYGSTSLVAVMLVTIFFSCLCGSQYSTSKASYLTNNSILASVWEEIKSLFFISCLEPFFIQMGCLLPLRDSNGPQVNSWLLWQSWIESLWALQQELLASRAIRELRRQRKGVRSEWIFSKFFVPAECNIELNLFPMNTKSVYNCSALPRVSRHLPLALPEVVFYDSEDEIGRLEGIPGKLRIPEVLYPHNHFTYSPGNLFGTLNWS